MEAALYGKHAAWGDFLQAGLPPQMQRGLETWLDASLSDARTDLGVLWEQAWDAAPVLRFWIGEGVAGAVMCGVMAASQDRVGRRFPLLMLAVGPPEAAPMPPVIDASQHWYERAEAHLLHTLKQSEGLDVGQSLSGFPMPVVDEGGVSTGPCDFWAVLPGVGLGALLADVALTDHRRAAAARSYWWVAGEGMPMGQESPMLPESKPVEVPQHEPGLPSNTAASNPDLPPALWDAGSDEAASPFAGEGDGAGLFVPPMPQVAGDGVSILSPDDVQSRPPAPPASTAPRTSRFHAGAGLPSGVVLAWFLRS